MRNVAELVDVMVRTLDGSALNPDLVERARALGLRDHGSRDDVMGGQLSMSADDVAAQLRPLKAGQQITVSTRPPTPARTPWPPARRMALATLSLAAPAALILGSVPPNPLGAVGSLSLGIMLTAVGPVFFDPLSARARRVAYAAVVVTLVAAVALTWGSPRTQTPAWPALGATAAVMFAVPAVVNAVRARTGRRRDDLVAFGAAVVWLCAFAAALTPATPTTVVAVAVIAVAWTLLAALPAARRERAAR